MFVVHFRLIVFMTEDTFKDSIVVRVDVAVIAVIPCLTMLARVDGEVLGIVIPICRRPRRR